MRKKEGTAPEPLLAMDWSYANPGGALRWKKWRQGDQRARRFRSGRQVPGFGALKDDGSTLCGNWLYSGSVTEDGNQIARQGQEDPTGLGLFAKWAWSWPANRRVLYNRASADASGKPWDESRAAIRWKDGRWTGDVP